MSGVATVVDGVMYADVLVTSADYAARPLSGRIDDAVALIHAAWDFRGRYYGQRARCARIARMVLDTMPITEKARGLQLLGEGTK